MPRKEKKLISDKKNQQNNKPIFRGLILSNIISCEYLLENGKMKHVLNGASIGIHKDEILGISGRTRLELIVLIEVLGSMRSYYKGKAKLSALGAQREKKRIVDEIFYIDSPNMLQGSMLVLEQIMFAMYQKKMDVLAKQKKLMDLLIRLGMKNLMLKKIDDLSDNQRIIIEILIGLLSQSEIVVVNIVDNEFTQEEITLLKNVSDFAKSIRKGLVVATMQPKMIGIAFDNVAYVIDGKISCHEPVEQLCSRLDSVVCVIKGGDYALMKEILERNLKGVSCYQSNGMLVVDRNYISDIKIGAIYELFEKNGIDCDYIKINKGRVLNSFEELIKRHDL